MGRLALTALLAVEVLVAPVSLAKPPLTLEQVFGAQAIRLNETIDSQWQDGGASYTTVEKSDTAEGFDIVRYSSGTGERTVVVEARELLPDNTSKPLEIADYEWSADGRYLLVFTSTRKFRRTDALGDYWLLDREKAGLRRLGHEAEPQSLMYAEFSPDGGKVAYVYRHNLYVEDVDSGAQTQLTRDGSETIFNGMGDWVNEEEFFIGKGYQWSPDSSRILYWQFDTAGVGTFYMVKNTGVVYPEPTSLQYPKPGTANSAVRGGTVAVEGGETVWFRLEGDPRRHYIPRMGWADSSEEVLVQYQNRAQNTNRVLLAEVGDGTVHALFADRDEAWVDANEDPTWLRSGRHFTWLSERDGWRHLYLVSRDGTDVELRTRGDFDVVSVECIDEENGYVYYIASPANPTQRYLYRSPLFQEGEPERLTPATAAGWHSYDVSPDSRWAFHTVSRFGEPPVTHVVRLPEHRNMRVLVDNPGMRALLDGTELGDAGFFRVDIGGILLDGWMMKPPSFDPAKKYPLLVYVYGEPAGQTVVDRWGDERYLWHVLLTQKGYIVASIDNRGTPAPRGRAWRKSIYGQIGILASADQAAAVNALIAKHDFIDAERVGVWGWSGGGAMTLNAMFRYPELYSTGIAIASPVDQHLYNAIYQERYMGLPAENERGYTEGSPINFAQNLKGDLLLVHGTGDDNVHYQNLEQLVDRLIGYNKQFSMMTYPDRRHGIEEKRNTRLHLFTLLTDYLDQHLRDGEPR